MILDGQEIVDALADEVGEALRSVAEYDRNGYELYHVRDDVEEAYSAGEIRQVYEQIDIEGLGYNTLQRVFKAGDLGCATYTFEDGRTFHFPIEEFSGLFVSIDRAGAVDQDAVIDRVWPRSDGRSEQVDLTGPVAPVTSASHSRPVSYTF